MKIVIVGGSFAGIHTAMLLRRYCSDSEIILIEKQNEIGYIPSGFSLFLQHKITDKEQLCWMTKEELAKEYHIEVYTGVTVTGIKGKKIMLASTKDHEDNENRETMQFDRLVIATGSSQSFPELSLSELDQIYSVKASSEMANLQQKIETAKKIAIIGAGQVGLDIAEAVITVGKEVHLYESRRSLLFRYFDAEMTEDLAKEMEKRGVHLFLKEQVQVLTEQNEAFLETEKRKEAYDLILLANHTRPDNRIWKEQLRLNDDGTIWVDDYLQTSQEDVYAIGDAIQVTFRPTLEKMFVSLVNNAIRTAQAVSKTISGFPTKDVGTYRPVGNQWFGYYLGSVGLTEGESIFYPGKIEIHEIECPVSAVSRETVKLKLLCDTHQHLIGAQLQSKSSIFHLLDLLTIAVEHQWTLAQLEEQELFFQPEYRVPKLWTKVADSANEN